MWLDHFILFLLHFLSLLRFLICTSAIEHRNDEDDDADNDEEGEERKYQIEWLHFNRS